MADGGDFYVGYRASAPPGLARHLRRVVLALLVLAAACGALLAALQRPFADSHFEYGNVRSFSGELTERPHPAIALETPTELAGQTHLLVATGKRGADDVVAGLAGRRVEVEGQRIYRDADGMIEIASGGLDDVGSGRRSRNAGAARSFGELRLTGEIVDSKCHLGVMKPGEGKPHRACAARCISGGAPPMLWVRDREGASGRFLLVGRDGRQLNAEILDLVAEPVRVTGEVVLGGGLWTLRTEPDEIERLEARDE